jgi:predicted nucleic acid-binding protein
MQVIQRVQAVFDEAEAARSSVSIVELTHGIYRAKTDADREGRKVFCDELCRAMIVQPVSLEIAQLAGRIEGGQAAKGIAIAEVTVHDWESSSSQHSYS